MNSHITIAPIVPVAQYLADGISRDFAFPFPIFASTEVEVWIGSTLQEDGYAVFGARSSEGGAVRFAVAPPSNQRITLRRRQELARTTDLAQGQPVLADDVNDGFDRTVAALQELADELGRTLRRPVTADQAQTIDLALPEPVAGMAIGWNATAGGLANIALPGSADFLRKSENLADLTNVTTARSNLGVYSTAQVDAALADLGTVKVSAGDTIAATLNAKLVAGDNVAIDTVTGTSGQALRISAPTSAVQEARLAALEQMVTNLSANQGVLALRSQKASGWSVLPMIDGVSDDFQDLSGIASLGGATHDAAGDYLHNPGGYLDISAQANAVNLLNGQLVSGMTLDLLRNGVVTHNGGLPYVGNLGGSADWAFGYDFATTQTFTKVRFDNFATWGCIQNFKIEVYSGGAWVKAPIVAWPENCSAYATDEATAVSPGTYNAGMYVSVIIAPTQGTAIRVRGTSLYNFGNANAGSEELAVFTSSTPADVTIVSSVFTAQVQPSEARIVILHQAVDTVAINTDVVAEISRDGGTSWAAVSLTDEGAFDSSGRILAGTAILTTQPAGASMVWRLRTLNTKEQRLHGVSLQWR